MLPVGSGRPPLAAPVAIPVDLVGDATDSTADRGDAASLRRRLGEDGYLLVRRVLPLEAVAAVRSAIVEVLGDAGVVVVPAEGLADPFCPIVPVSAGGGVDVHGEAGLFRQLYSLEVLHRLPHHEAALGIARSLLGEGTALLVHPRPALRVVFPGTEVFSGATPPHQDHLGMQGTESTLTFWMPLGRCAIEAGVLAVAAGSHHGGLRPYRAMAGARVAGCDAADLAGRWVAADLDPGDLIVFHSLTVHSALANRSGEVRLSLDARYQAASEPVCAATLGDPPHMTWDDVYAGWPEESSDVKRYWQKMKTNVVPFDPSQLVGGDAAEGQ